MNFLENKFTSALFSLKLHQFPLKYTNLARLSIFYVSKYDSMQDLSHGAAQIDPYSLCQAIGQRNIKHWTTARDIFVMLMSQIN